MLGREVLVLHLLGLFLRVLKEGVRSRAKILLPARHLRKLSDRRFDVGQDRLCIGTDLAQYRFNNALGLCHHHRE